MWSSKKQPQSKHATNPGSAQHQEPTLDLLLSHHNSQNQLLHALVSASREYTASLQHAAEKEERLLRCLSNLYDAGITNDLTLAGVDPSTLHDTQKRHPRSLDLTKKLTPTSGGAGSDAGNAADFNSNLLEGWANGVTSSLVQYMRGSELMGAHVARFEASRLKYDHYVYVCPT
jgi:hypothetical protein